MPTTTTYPSEEQLRAAIARAWLTRDDEAEDGLPPAITWEDEAFAPFYAVVSRLWDNRRMQWPDETYNRLWVLVDEEFDALRREVEPRAVEALVRAAMRFQEDSGD